MTAGIRYLTYAELLEAHDDVLAVSGGLAGINNQELLLGCIDFIRNNEYYPDFDDKLAHLVYSIAKNHAFADGNKRTSIACGAAFLIKNGFKAKTVDLFIRKMECLILHVVANEISKDEMRQIIQDYVYNGELSKKSLEIYAEKGLDPNEQPQ